jgi:hypothetical protein
MSVSQVWTGLGVVMHQWSQSAPLNPKFGSRAPACQPPIVAKLSEVARVQVGM